MVDEDYAIPTTVLRHFDLSSSPYDDARIAKINNRRTRYPEGQLFIDRLLHLAGIDGSRLYPPTSPAGYRRLLASIHNSELDRLKMDCLYYYLLNDYRTEAGVQRHRAGEFARKRCLSKTWKGFMEGYWNLDNGFFEAGVTNLTNPAITEVNFPSAVIHTLASVAEPPSLACSLIHTFLLTRIPTDQTPQVDIEIYTTVLASVSSVPSAFSYIRSLSSDAQGRLREIVWSWALGAPKVPCGYGPSVVQQKAIKEILHLPLLAEEDDHLLSFLLAPPKTISPTALSLLHDLVTLRLIHQGKYAESLQLDKELAGSGGKEDDRQRRREMVREFIAILPEAQRRALAVDSQLNADRREKELVNGGMDLDVPAEDADDDMVEVDQGYTHTTPAATITPAPAPAPAPAFPLEKSAASQPKPRLPSTTSRPASPAPAPRVVSTHSPFSGPPRFATNPNLPSSPHGTPLQRVLSGSPFTLPMSKGANAVRSASISRTPTNQIKPLPIPRPKPRPEIRDEGNEEQVRRKINRSEAVTRETEQEEEEEMMVDQTEEEAHGKSEVDHNEASAPQAEIDHQKEVERETGPTPEPEPESEPESEPQPRPQSVEAEPEPEPAPTPRMRRSKRMPTTSPVHVPAQRRSSRQTTVPTSPTHRIPGTFEPVPEDRQLESTTHSQTQSQSQGQTTQGISRSRTRRQLSAAPSEPSKSQGQGQIQGRSRMTRSASRATLGDPSEDEPRAPKRSRRLSAASEMSELTSGPTPTPARRSGRSKRDGESQRGSPTPSVAASVGTGARSRRGASQTPRKSTRTKK